MGGYLGEYGSYSTAQILDAMKYMYGKGDNNTPDDIANAKLVVMFGSNFLETGAGGGAMSFEVLDTLRKNGNRVIIIDPRYSDTVAKLAAQWIPVRPGSDAALCAALTNILIKEGKIDQDFLDRCCIGFDDAHLPEGVANGSSYRSYVLGDGTDKTEKTPQWAAKITGCPPDLIVSLAREIAEAKPACIVQGRGPQRHANGDTISRAICTLAAMTGNIGISGGSTGFYEGTTQIPFPRIPTGKNPVPAKISFFTWEEAISHPENVTDRAMGLRGKKQLEHGIKFLWNSAGNSLLNQHSDINKIKKTLEDEKACEFIVVVETRMTPSAKYADILLPSVTALEQDDIIRQGDRLSQSLLSISRKAIEPVYESKTLYDICNELAGELGRQMGDPGLQARYNEGRSQLDWVKYLYGKCREMRPDLPEDFEEASRIGWFKWHPMPAKIAFQKFREDPVANPLKTPSGKIEIFSSKIDEHAKKWQFSSGETVHAIPVHDKTWEGPDDYLTAERFPFQLIGHHYKGRTHSSYANLPTLARIAPQELWINNLDAMERGIQQGDLVEVYNDRGIVRIPAKVTPRIMPGVLSMPQGAWYKPDSNGVDLGGRINILTRSHPTPLAKGNPQHTNRVNIRKA